MKRVLMAASIAATVFGANAQPVKCVDASGRTRYIDAAAMGQEKCQPVRAEANVVPAQPPTVSPASRSPAPTKAALQRTRQEARLKDAEQRLAQAKAKLAEQEAIRSGDERNYARVLERLKPYQEAVERAEKDVERARKEIE